MLKYDFIEFRNDIKIETKSLKCIIKIKSLLKLYELLNWLTKKFVILLHMVFTSAVNRQIMIKTLFFTTHFYTLEA